jgi:hypothetical protein
MENMGKDKNRVTNHNMGNKGYGVASNADHIWCFMWALHSLRIVSESKWVEIIKYVREEKHKEDGWI